MRTEDKIDKSEADLDHRPRPEFKATIWIVYSRKDNWIKTSAKDPSCGDWHEESTEIPHRDSLVPSHTRYQTEDREIVNLIATVMNLKVRLQAEGQVTGLFDHDRWIYHTRRTDAY